MHNAEDIDISAEDTEVVVDDLRCSRPHTLGNTSVMFVCLVGNWRNSFSSTPLPSQTHLENP